MTYQLFSRKISGLSPTGLSYKSTPSPLLFGKDFFQNNLTFSKKIKNIASLLYFHSFCSEQPLFFAETLFGTATLLAK